MKKGSIIALICLIILAIKTICCTEANPKNKFILIYSANTNATLTECG